LGDRRFWTHVFNRCLLDVHLIVREEDTGDSYYQRTGHTGMIPKYKQKDTYLEYIENLSSLQPNLCLDWNRPDFGNRDNIIYMFLEPYFSTYDYYYDDFESEAYEYIRIIYDYLGWFYEFEWHWNLDQPFKSVTDDRFPRNCRLSEMHDLVSHVRGSYVRPDGRRSDNNGIVYFDNFDDV
jgi:hypothetical protein